MISFKLDQLFKEKVTPKTLLFLPSPIASKHSAFPLTEVSTVWSPLSPEEIKEASSDAPGQNVSSARPSLCNVIPSDLKLTGREKRQPLQPGRSAKSIFSSEGLSTSRPSMLSFRVWLKIIWLKIIWLKSSQACRNPFGENLLDGITSRERSLADEYCSKWRQQFSNFGLLWRRIL